MAKCTTQSKLACVQIAMASSNDHKVKFAYISDFYESEAAIVFAGSAASLNKFATMLLDLAHGKQRQNIHFNEIDLFE